jgi:hypothetical protein
MEMRVLDGVLRLRRISVTVSGTKEEFNCLGAMSINNKNQRSENALRCSRKVLLCWNKNCGLPINCTAKRRYYMR